jgi:threonine/homoserine/homoserine lactone efflux protein
MDEAIAEAVPFAMGIAVSPVPIIGVALMLGTPRARVTGPAFALGWLVGIALVGVVVLLVSNGARREGGQTSDWVSALKLVLGVVFLAIGIRQWRSRPRGGEEPPIPRWLQAIDGFSPGRARAWGMGCAAVNPKNILLVIGGAAAIVRAEVPTAGEWVALAIFVAVATLGVGIPVAVYFALGDRSRNFLEGLRRWMSAHNATLTALIFTILAVKLISDALRALA